MPRPAGYEALARELFSSQLPDLQVTPRRRKANSTTNSIAAGAVGYVQSSVAMDSTDNLKTGDAVFFDYIMAAWGGNQALGGAQYLLLESLAFQLLDQVGNFATIDSPDWGQIVNQQGTQNVVSLVPSKFEIQPKLWTTQDINFVLRGTPDPVLLNQPLKFQVTGAFFNNGAAANTAQINLSIFYRIVRGLQEG